jgi:DNA polymerase-3 subunit gamma/tau
MLGVVGRDEVGTLLQALAEGSVERLVAIAAELAERSTDFADVLRGLMEALHELAVQSALGHDDSAFSAQELQLYYQIALIGLRDLSIAPDERSGFEMTLLRMLAFAPEPSSKVPPREPEASEKSQSSSVAPTVEQQASAPARAEPQPEKVVQNSELASQWFDLVDRMPVGGVTRMIAEHSILQRMELPQVELLLNEGHDTLLNQSQVEHLSRALEDLLGQQVNLQVRTGPTDTETPAARREREARERQARAEDAIATDDKVQHLLAEFGGRVDAIRPV